MKYLNIADYNIAVEGFEYDYFKTRMAEYFTDLCDKTPDITITYEEKDKIDVPTGEYISTSLGYRKYFRQTDVYQIYDVLKEPDLYSAAIDYNHKTGIAKTQMFDVEPLGGTPNDIRCFNMMGELFRYFVLKNGGMVMHSSCMAYKGEGVMFSAPSGTGKSTHTGLWRKYYAEDVTMINDDSPVLRFNENGIKVCGTPWSGKTDINHNISVPLRAIVILWQSPENTIRRLSTDEAVFRVMNEVTRPPFDELMEVTLCNIEKILKTVPVYMLGCTISQEAVELVRKTVF